MPIGWTRGIRMRSKGFSHVVITTAHTPVLGGFFAALGWRSLTIDLSPDALTFWGVEQGEAPAMRWIPPSNACEVLLIPMPQEVKVLRPVHCAVTTPGGLFDINMRTVDSDWSHDFLQSHGWQPLVDPVAWQFGDIETKEGLYIQEDGIVLAVMERLQPPLPTVAFDRMSDVFNATQMVRRVDQTVTFLKHLGFERFIQHHGPLPGEGPKVLQLEGHSADTGDIELAVLHPTGAMDGSLELVEVLHHPTQRLTVPPGGGRGLRSLCLPVDDIEACYEGLLASQWSSQIIHSLAPRALPGVLSTISFAIAAPDGGRLDVYQSTA